LAEDGRSFYGAHFVDGIIKLFTLHVEDTIAIAQARLTRDLTEQECQQYLHLDSCPDPTH
jgi:hypothetical protein